MNKKSTDIVKRVHSLYTFLWATLRFVTKFNYNENLKGKHLHLFLQWNA